MTVWAARRARALALASESDHAIEILRCYAQITEAQERIAVRLPAREWTAAALVQDADGPPLMLGRLPLSEVLPFFGDFLTDMAGIGTGVMIAEAARLAAESDDHRRTLLGASLAHEDRDGAEATFHARAFAEVVATTLAGRVLPTAGSAEGFATTAGTTRSPSSGPSSSPSSGPTTCRTCGAPPIAGTLRDLPGALGAGGLVCSRCGSEQRVRRLTCPYCGESNADRLRVHSAESVPHVRIDECVSCRRYIKTVDFRRRGDAVPVVEDLATPELDLWAQEQGLIKGRTNLFAM